MNNFVFDVETTNIESTAIVLSAAIVYFDPEKDIDITYDELVERTLYVKFNAAEQKAMGRSVSRSTLEWWNKQSKMIKDLCFLPSPKDLSVEEGLNRLRDYVSENGDNPFIWARGSLDQMVIESLTRDVEAKPIVHFNSWCDVRTAIRLLKDTSNRNGYCDIPGFDAGTVDKHNPIADVCYDALMLIKGA